MSDTPETPEAPVEENSTIKEMREAMKRKDAENAALRNQVIGSNLSAIGLEPDRGLGKAIAQGYSGDDLSPDAIAAFAKAEYDYEKPVQAPETPAAQQFASAQQRVDGFGQSAAPVAPASGEDVIRAHDQRLAAPEATRQDALNALEAKVQHYIQP